MPGSSNAMLSPLERNLCDRFERVIPEQVNSDKYFIWRGRNLTAACLIQIGSIPFLLQFQGGRISELQKQPPIMSPWNFAVRGSVSAWDGLWRNPPPPGWHDIFALAKRGEMTIEGNFHPLMANLQYLKDVLILPRERGSK
jgi:hypothetical protein